MAQSPPPDAPEPEPAAGEARAALAQVRAERDALQDRCDRLQAALDAACDGVWDADLVSGRVRFSAGWGRMLGFEPGELEPTVSQVMALTHPDDRDRVERTFHHHLAAANDAGYRLAFRLVHRRGHPVEVVSRGRALRDAAGRPVRFIGTHADVTQAVREAEALRADRAAAEAARRAAERVAAQVVGEARGALDRLDAADGGADGRRTPAVRDALAGAAATLDDAETLLKLRTRPPRPRRAALDLDELMAEVEADAAARAGAGGAAVTCRRLGGAAGCCVSDRGLLAEALGRLIRHAIQTRPGAAVHLVAEPGEARGTDHREEAIAFRVTGGAGGDGGLHLALAERLITLLGGTLRHREEPETGPAGDARPAGWSHGFTLRFPAAAATPAPSGSSRQRGPADGQAAAEAAAGFAAEAAWEAAARVAVATEAVAPDPPGPHPPSPAALVEREVLALHAAGELSAAAHRIEHARRSAESALHAAAATRARPAERPG
ncbi:PAS domain-containing protein [Phycisphaera mikurensis]|uniref:histidine kinase n=1 Tax=Phycisphaera mikurensis (strain NBRC 102666 / KCTC 22515 / FYK2301M01) TaxID=1142394 RepID=I0IIV2_PHYMF|nr:PAS domain-containing protein [Phycisphaera mikurensis]MBB6443355.1 PAS domain S-box-containing protein [Phycisphaera mikurensis]BAM05190.1 putative signaling protein [Phycisphaera mikurensis NBRC 102666]